MFTEPLKLSLGYKYNLNVMEEIVAKDSLLTLDENVKKCQENPQDLCTNKKFFDTLKSQCQCLPFTLRFLAKQVCIHNKIGLISIHESYI